MANTPQVNTRNRVSGKWAGFSILVVVVFIAIGLFVLFSNESSNTLKSGADINAPSEDKTVGGDGTPEYNDALIKQEKKESELAKKQGASHIAGIVGNNSSQNLNKLNVITTPPPPENQQKNLVVASHRSPPPRHNGRQQNAKPTIQPNYASQMASIMGLMALKPSVTTVYKIDKKINTNPTTDNAVAVSTVPTGNQLTTSNLPSQPKLNLSPRSILYAVNDLRLNSDINSSHVRATVLSGEYRDAVLNGKFTRYQGKLTLSFNQLVTKEDQVYTINGYAIDPQTTEASVASDVDWHILSRWGGLASAAFLSGLGSAVQMSGQSVASSGVSGQLLKGYPQYSLMEKGAIGLGKVGNKLSAIMTKNFSRPPTVTLETGVTMGIIILSAQ